MTTGERIKNLRIARHMSQEELADKVGLKKAAISKYETGLVVNIKRDVIGKLADALETAPTYPKARRNDAGAARGATRPGTGLCIQSRAEEKGARAVSGKPRKGDCGRQRKIPERPRGSVSQKRGILPAAQRGDQGEKRRKHQTRQCRQARICNPAGFRAGTLPGLRKKAGESKHHVLLPHLLPSGAQADARLRGLRETFSVPKLVSQNDLLCEML